MNSHKSIAQLSDEARPTIQDRQDLRPSLCRQAHVHPGRAKVTEVPQLRKVFRRATDRHR